MTATPRTRDAREAHTTSIRNGHALSTRMNASMRDAIERTLAHHEEIEHIWTTRGIGANALVVTGTRVLIVKKSGNFLSWQVHTMPSSALSGASFKRGLGRGRWQTVSYVSFGSSASPTLRDSDRRATDIGEAALLDPYTVHFDNNTLDEIARVIASV